MAEPDDDRSRISSFSERRATTRVARLYAVDRGIATMAGLVAAAYGVTVEQLLQVNRGPAELALARQVAMYLARTFFEHNTVVVGELFGRDRTTVAHACAVIEDRRERPHFDEMIAAIEARLTARSSAGEGDRAAS